MSWPQQLFLYHFTGRSKETLQNLPAAGRSALQASQMLLLYPLSRVCVLLPFVGVTAVSRHSDRQKTVPPACLPSEWSRCSRQTAVRCFPIRPSFTAFVNQLIRAQRCSLFCSLRFLQFPLRFLRSLYWCSIGRFYFRVMQYAFEYRYFVLHPISNSTIPLTPTLLYGMWEYFKEESIMCHINYTSYSM